jgi:hypothetical protein
MQRPTRTPAKWRPAIVVPDDERGPLVGSYAIANALALGFLLLVHFGPATRLGDRPVPPPPTITVGDLVQAPDPRTIAGATAEIVRRARDAARARATPRGAISSAVGTAFTSRPAAGVIDPRKIFGGIDVRAAGSVAAVVSKTILAHDGASLSSTPGRGGMGGAAGNTIDDGRIGAVGGSSGIRRASVTIAPPTSVAITGERPAGGTSELATYVRGRAATLEFCYLEYGLAANPRLAGTIAVTMTVDAGGAITEARVTRRTWSALGGAETEACILRLIRTWRLSAGGHGPATYSLPFSFTR